MRMLLIGTPRKDLTFICTPPQEKEGKVVAEDSCAGPAAGGGGPAIGPPVRCRIDVMD